MKTTTPGPPRGNKSNGGAREVWNVDKVTIGKSPVLDLFDGRDV